MNYIPVRYKRVAAAFDDEARARLCGSSGSEHSAAEDSQPRLSELVESFFEKDVWEEEIGDEEATEERDCGDDEDEYEDSESETADVLVSLIGGDAEEEDGGVRRMIREAVEVACRNPVSGSPSTEDFKRRVMSLLRQRGFDAGLCKSRWEKTGGRPAGHHEYIDIIFSGTRYIVETSLAAEFTIARPTDHYSCLLQLFPHIVVTKECEQKQVVRLMCAAARASMKKRGMTVPPWRRNGYVQAKWFGNYKRTTNMVAATKVPGPGHGSDYKRFLGFDMSETILHRHCRAEAGRKIGNLKVGIRYR